MSVLSRLRLIAPDLTLPYTDIQLNEYIEIAVEQLDPCIWGALYTQGLANLTAHLLSTYTVRATAAVGSGAPGPVTMETAGRVTLQYASPKDWENNALVLSPWGQELMRLGKKLAGRHMFTTGFRDDDMCHPNAARGGEDNRL